MGEARSRVGVETLTATLGQCVTVSTDAKYMSLLAPRHPTAGDRASRKLSYNRTKSAGRLSSNDIQREHRIPISIQLYQRQLRLNLVHFRIGGGGGLRQSHVVQAGLQFIM